MTPPENSPIRARVLCLVVFALVGAAGASLAANVGIEIHPGDQTQSAIDYVGDEDPHAFEAVAGTVFSATVSRPKSSSLVPSIRLVGPGGTDLAIDANVKASEKKVSLKKFTLSTTGRYALVVFGANGTTGAYSLKTSGKAPKSSKNPGIAIGVGESRAISFGGGADASLAFSVKIRSGGAGLDVLDLRTPEGETVPGFADALKFTKKGLKGKAFLTQDLGEFELVLGGVSEATTVDVTLKVKFPKHKKEKKEIGSVEPLITGVAAIGSGQPYGVEGTEVGIDGSDFDQGPVAPQIWFGDARVTSILFRSDKRILVRAPKGSGEVDLAVVNPDGNMALAKDGFTYVGNPPGGTTANPVVGPVTGGTVVTVTGVGLSDVSEIRIGSTTLAGAPTIISSSSISFTTEAHGAGSFPIVLVDRFGQTSSPFSDFRFVEAPIVDAVAPAGGNTTGGTLVTLHGPDLDLVSEFYVDGVSTAASYVAPDGLRFTTAAHAAGTVSIRLVDVFGQETVLPEGYEYNNGAFLDGTDGRIPEGSDTLSYRGESVAASDVDGDKDLDFVITRDELNGAEKLTKLLLNNGSGVFTSVTTANLPKGNTDTNDWLQGTAVAMGDLDGDGDEDMVVTSNTWINNPNRISYGGTYGTNAYYTPYPSTRILLNDSDGKFSFAPSNALPDVKLDGADLLQGDAVALGDVDGDTDLDIVITRDSAPATTYVLVVAVGYGASKKYYRLSYKTAVPATRVLINNGKGVFANATGTRIPGLSGGDMFVGEDVHLVDVNGDTKLDIVLVSENPDTREAGKAEWVNDSLTGSQSKLRILTNDGSGSFSNATSSLMPDPHGDDDWSGRGLAIGDVDEDGAVDLVLTTNREVTFYDLSQPDLKNRPSRTRVLLAQSGGGFADATASLMPTVRPDGKGEHYSGETVEVADVDGDGRNDIIVASKDRQYGLNPLTGNYDRRISATRILLNTGEGVMKDATTRRLPDPIYGNDDLRASDFVYGEFSGDGKKDLILTTIWTFIRPTKILLFK
jgi:hypothetical protein